MTIYAEALEQQAAALAWLGAGGRNVANSMALLIARSGNANPEVDINHQFGEALEMPLRDGDAYYWSPRMARLLSDLASSVPPVILEPDLLPTTAGYFWFSEPISTPDGEQIHALSWCAVGAAVSALQSVYMFPWLVYPQRATGVPVSMTPWKIHASSEPILAGKQTVFQGGDNPLPRGAITCRLFSAALLLLEQRILIGHQERPDRATRRRLERSRPEAAERSITVIEMRRPERASNADAGERSVEWSCSWITRGHWRQQPFGPKRAQTRPRWIAPFVKGDLDKPLKNAERVFAVIR